MSSKRRSVGMSRSAINNVFEDVFASTVKTGTSHSVTHGDASRRETSAFGPDLHDPRDLSAMDWHAFVAAYKRIILRAVGRMKPDTFACFVVGDFRDGRG